MESAPINNHRLYKGPNHFIKALVRKKIQQVSGKCSDVIKTPNFLILTESEETCLQLSNLAAS